MKRLLVAAVAVPLLLVTAGCGSAEQSAADQVPALSARLDSIDAAVAAHRYRAARDRIGELVDATVSARDAGDLDRAAADNILASAAQLLASLPVVTPTPSPTTTPSRTSKPAPTKADEPAKPKKKHGKGKGGKHDR